MKPRTGIIDLLLSHQVGPRFDDGGQAIERYPSNRVLGLAPPQLRARTVDVHLRALQRRFGLRQFLRHLGRFEFGDQLTLLHLIADIHVDRLEIAGNLCVKVDLLIRPEFGRQLKAPAQVLPCDLLHGDRADVSSLACAPVLARVVHDDRHTAAATASSGLR